MSYIPLGHVATGDLATAALQNTFQDNVDFVYAGGLAIPSQANLDFIYPSSATQLARLAKGGALSYPRINAANNAYEFANPTITLLKAGSGTSTAAAAANVDTIAMASGLTALDTLMVVVVHGSTTQATGAPRLYNSTDSLDVAVMTALAAASLYSHVFFIKQRQTGATKVSAWGNNTDDGTANRADRMWLTTATTFTTNWTGAWTLALRHNGVTAGGTYDYTWAVFKLSGQ